MKIGLVGKIVIGVLALLVLVVGGVAAALMTLDVNRFKDVIAREAEAATGRTLTIDGKVSLELGLTPTIAFSRVTLGNAAWGSEPAMVSVGRFAAELDLIPALSGDIRVNRLVLADTAILLEVKDGKANWDLGNSGKPAADRPATRAEAREAREAAKAAGGASATPLPGLAAVRIDDLRLTYKDHGAGTTQAVKLDSLALQAPDPKAPAKLEAAGTAQGIAFDIAGSIGALADLAAGGGGKPYPIDLKGEVAGIAFTAKGSIKDLAAAKGIDMALTAKADRLDGLKPLAGDLPAVPPLSLKTTLADTAKGAWRLSDLDLTVGQTRLTGSVSADVSGPRPAVDAKLAAPLVDLRELLPEAAKEAKANAGRLGGKRAKAGEAKGGQGGGKVLPDDPLPLDGLKAADARFDVAVGKLILPNGLEFEDIAAKGSLQGGKLGLKPYAMKLGGGTLRAEIDLDASAPKRAALSADVAAKGVVLGALFQQIGQSDLLGGAPTDATLKLSGAGGSVAGILGSLDGPIRIEVGKGRINNALIDWAGADVIGQLTDMMSGDKSDHAELTCAVINTRAKDGTLTWDKQIAVQTSKMNVASSGSLNLKTEGLDVAVRPYARGGTGVSAGKLAEMVRLQGTLGAPKVGLDAEGVARTALSVAGALATGGASLLAEGLVDRGTSDPDPCATALGKAPAKAADGGKDGKGGKERGGVGGAITDAPAKALEGVGKGLGGLLGR